MNNMGCEKNNRGKERADEIVELFCCIAKAKENRHVKEYLEKSNIYQEIQNGNEVFLYDSSAANLLEITCELRKDYGDCLGSQYITVDSISDYYREQFGLKKRPTITVVEAKRNKKRRISAELIANIAAKRTEETPRAVGVRYRIARAIPTIEAEAMCATKKKVKAKKRKRNVAAKGRIKAALKA